MANVYKSVTYNIQVGYPDELAYKLYDRKGKILVVFRQMADAEIAYKAAIKYLDKVNFLFQTCIKWLI